MEENLENNEPIFVYVVVKTTSDYGDTSWRIKKAFLDEALANEYATKMEKRGKQLAEASYLLSQHEIKWEGTIQDIMHKLDNYDGDERNKAALEYSDKWAVEKERFVNELDCLTEEGKKELLSADYYDSEHATFSVKKLQVEE